MAVGSYGNRDGKLGAYRRRAGLLRIFGDGLAIMEQPLQVAADSVLGHHNRFLVGLTLGNATRQGRNIDVVSALLGWFNPDSVSIDLHLV